MIESGRSVEPPCPSPYHQVDCKNTYNFVIRSYEHLLHIRSIACAASANDHLSKAVRCPVYEPKSIYSYARKGVEILLSIRFMHGVRVTQQKIHHTSLLDNLHWRSRAQVDERQPPEPEHSKRASGD